MGLDIYAGTLTRYYAQNWKTAVQQWAEENGYSFSKITPDGEMIEEEKPSPAQVQTDMQNWQDAIIQLLTDAGCLCSPWMENNEKPYYTDKPDWDAFGALLLYGACRIYDKPLPPTVVKHWNFYEHPIVKQALEDNEVNWSLFSGAEWWLPLEGCFSFQCLDPLGNERMLGTVDTLLAELEKINSLGWNAGEETILHWSNSEGYPVDGQMENGQLSSIQKHTEYHTESLAKFAFSLLWQAARFAVEHRVPVIMDY